MASREGAPESDSYGWIISLLVLLNLSIACDEDVTSGCVPQGQLKSSTGVKAPDFTILRCSTSSRDPGRGVLYSWWEVKNFANRATLKSMANQLWRYFVNTFLSCFPQLSDQAVTAFAANGQVKVFRSFFSCGTHFSLIEWPSDASERPPPDPGCTWMIGFEANVFAVIANSSRKLLTEFPDYARIQQWVETHPVGAHDLSEVVRSFRKQVSDQLAKCELIRSGLTLPRIYFFFEDILCGDKARPNRLHEELQWHTIRNVAPKFLKAVELVNNSPSLPGTHRVSAPAGSFFAPPEDIVEFTPSDKNLVRLTVWDAH